MILKCTKEELNTLIKKCIVEYNGLTYSLLTKEYNGSSIELSIDFEEVSGLYTETKISSKTNVSVEDAYALIRKAFPVDINSFFAMRGGRSLRTGRPQKCKEHIKTLMAEGLTPQNIVSAIEYEVETRVSRSTPRDNQLQYMQGMEAWLNNSENVRTMYECSLEKNNNNGPGISTQQIF